MLAQGRHYRTIWLKQDDPAVVQIIDQRSLPHRFVIEDLATVDDMAVAIADMHLRGAGLIGAAAGYGMYIAALRAAHSSPEAFKTALERDAARLIATRPTAVNLEWAVRRVLAAIEATGYIPGSGVQAALDAAAAIADEDADFCRRIGENGKSLIREISRRKGGAPVNVLTHCNAGWLAFVDYGSATAPIYAAFEEAIPVHVWVDETRPRNQGARLTAWEMVQQGVPHTVIADNAGGHLMQHGLVDLVIVGADRVAYTGDVANKVGTYLKALAAHDNGVPFYVALPSSTFDWQLRDGIRDIPIEQRDGTEVRLIEGLHGDELVEVLLTPAESPAANYAFDVTPSRLVTGLITERGICAASEEAVLSLYPEKRR
jgi:methylthioribose-1-phosphate isomerase